MRKNQNLILNSMVMVGPEPDLVLSPFITIFFLGDHDRVIDEYERAISLYSDTDNEIFQKYLEEVESGIAVLKEELSR